MTSATPPRVALPTLTLIVARARNGVIGRDNRLPWRLPEDLAYFKRTTLGAPVIMGRKTHESIGRPLPGRLNLVITRDTQRRFTGCEVVHGLEAALTACVREAAPEAFLIGGSELYAAGMPRADRLLVTQIDADFEGDAFFAAPDPAIWRESRRDSHRGGVPEPFDFAFVEYLRR
ncbi:dihydrofolate reductase [Robbsia sp. Bb-Pol-6]|uniref:Dihydrofolate reductase n=1 Tax=Robbsia betulipollinis TaxID=2981849 RepID=A0ABT3ZRP9_9BURK|nr:dihydrofolate reductase [Robbsia betulipollinis]MCY0388610.1 dihydrofolate reductase [Robbsia betulipollinis]